MRTPIKDGKLIYHLTSIMNFESIIQHGLLPRNHIENFMDIADPEIIEFRSRNTINDYVPFHFFCKNPFDGRVQKDRPNENFIYICLQRNYARQNEFLIIPQHPISMDIFVMYSYNDGYNLIDWVTMDERDYYDPYCKNVCMAECVSSNSINPNDFFCIYVKDGKTETYVNQTAMRYLQRIPFRVNVMPNMFLE